MEPVRAATTVTMGAGRAWVGGVLGMEKCPAMKNSIQMERLMLPMISACIPCQHFFDARARPMARMAATSVSQIMTCFPSGDSHGTSQGPANRKSSEWPHSNSRRKMRQWGGGCWSRGAKPGPIEMAPAGAVFAPPGVAITVCTCVRNSPAVW